MRQITKFTSLQAKEAAARLGERIKRARKARKISLQALEARCGVHRTTLGRLEHGDPTVALGTLLAVMESLRELGDIELLLSQPETSPRLRKVAVPELDAAF